LSICTTNLIIFNQLVAMELLSSLTQLLYNGSSLVIVGYLSIPPCCNCLKVSINEFCIHYFCHQFLAPLTLISSLFLNTFFYYWLQIITIATTLISTLLSLGVVITLELTSLVLNMFCTLIFLGHSLDLCFTLEYII
jgi:hypothetical protein